MSWPCIIAFKNKQGVTFGIRSESDGTITETGLYLKYFYDTPSKIKKLFQLKHISYINMNVPTNEYLSKLEEQIKTNKWDFHYTEHENWTSASNLTPYWYLRFKFDIDCMTPIEVDEAHLKVTGSIRPKNELACIYAGIDNILKASYESLYMFDERKKQWLVGVNAQGANWIVAGEHAVKLVSILTEHKKEQQALAEKEGQEWDEGWLVFPNTKGKIPNLRNIDAAFHKILRNAGIQEATPHCLRHTYATRNFENGVDIKMISKQLGHKSVRTTYDIYIHVIKESAAIQIEKLNELDLMLA